MPRFFSAVFDALLGLTVGLTAQGVEAPLQVDVAVYGGSAGGVIAAVAAAREGKTVILIEPGQHVGGMVSGGLGATDVGNRLAIGGYAREFFDRVRDYYKAKYGAGSVQFKDCADGFRFEPHVAEHVFRAMLAEHNIQVAHGARLDKVTLEGRKITSITYDKASIAAKVYIDASYEGDLMAKAKVTYTLGRESRADFNESIAGVQKHSAAHQWPVKVSPFFGDKALLPLVQTGQAAPPGDGDKKIQAYNFRMCMTQRPDQKIDWPRPVGYDARRYELLARYIEKKPDLQVGQLMNPVKLPNGMTDTNNNGAFSTDHIGANWDYPEATYPVRDKIWQDHIDYQMGFCYFLAHDPRVPRKLQQEINSWGLARNEFTDTNRWPHQLYVRESRRLRGLYFMTQSDIMEHRTKEDSIGLGSYNTDSHHVQRIVGPDGFVLNEGDFQVGVQPYAIPYRSLVPKREECANLLVPVCMSASHVAYGTIRMEPVYMIMGQASGVAAALALKANVDVQSISVEMLKARLGAQKAVLSPELISKATTTGRAVSTMAGVVVDDQQAKTTGSWVFSAATPGFVGGGYLHDNNEGRGMRSARFTPQLPQAGVYDVRIHFPAHPNRASNVLVVVHSVAGEKTLRLNQKLTANEGYSLGKFQFSAGAEGWVEVRNNNADGYVIADAVQWILQK